MKVLKRAIIPFFAFFLVFVPVLNVSAAGEWTAFVREVTETDEGAKIYIHQVGEPTDIEDAVSCVVNIDGQTFDSNSIQRISEAGDGKAIICLVDVSGSMDEDRMNAVKDSLKYLVDNKADNDFICIVAVNSEQKSSDFMDSKEGLSSFIDYLAVTNDNTNLYDAINEGVNKLGARAEYTKAMIIFSDGAEYNSDGITKDEALSAVKEAGIPVYTVALPRPNDVGNEEVKTLGSFARSSAGGIDYIPQKDETTATDSVANTLNILNNDLVVTSNVSGLPFGEKEYDMTVTLKKGESSTETTYKLAASKVPNLVGEEEEKVTYVTNEVKEEVDTKPIFIIIAVVAAILVIAIIIFAMILSKKKRQALRARVTVTLVRLSDGQTFKHRLDDEVQIGRGDRCDITITGDGALSEHHCSILFDGTTIRLKDNDSKNGTYVNGVPIVGGYDMHDGDIIMIGQNEYEIHWESGK